MSDGTTLIYMYDGTFEGLMTAVFEAYAHRPMPDTIQNRCCQQTLGAVYEDIMTDDAKADRVIAGIRRKIGQEDYDKIWTAFLSDDPEKEDAIYQYIRLGIAIGYKIHSRLADDRVLKLTKISRLVGKEAGALIQFIRFSQMEGNIYYGEITPQYPILPMIMPHFAERYHIQPFIIHDKTHHQAGIFDTRQWIIADTDGVQLPEYAPEEAAYRALWKKFYDTIAIKERINPNLRRGHMPKKYWKNMVEMQPCDAEMHPSGVPSQPRSMPPAQDGSFLQDGAALFSSRPPSINQNQE